MGTIAGVVGMKGTAAVLPIKGTVGTNPVYAGQWVVRSVSTGLVQSCADAATAALGVAMEDGEAGDVINIMPSVPGVNTFEMVFQGTYAVTQLGTNVALQVDSDGNHLVQIDDAAHDMFVLREVTVNDSTNSIYKCLVDLAHSANQLYIEAA